ncbi:MAG: cytochrome c3 family protein [Gemmatimonadota bacterium]
MTRNRSPGPVPRRRLYAVAALAPVLALGILLLPGRERLRAAGPANTGHAELACAQCHTPADGTVRQQVQANVRQLVGLRESGADFLHKPVGNADCVACHRNEDDRHPVYRFNEPRFQEAREAIAPQYCVSCHVEHSGKRVTAEPTLCVSCHADMEIREDPIEPTHAQLALLEEWASCLGCHDFHGNHVRTTPVSFDRVLSLIEVRSYLDGGPPIYGRELRYPARTERAKP